MKNVKKKLIFLPIETKSREFDSKLLIALEAVNRGFHVIVCSKRLLLEHYPFPGIVFLKSAARYEQPYIASLRNNHMKCCVLDEEGLVHTSNEKEHSLRYSQSTIDSVDKVFFNGNYERDFLGKIYDFSTKGLVTGNPRFDLYKESFSNYYEEEAAKLKARYGRFILIPSRFALVNLALGDASGQAYLKFLEKNYVNNEEELNIFKGMLDHATKIYGEFISLLPSLSEHFPDIQIIIRPHPSEAMSSWSIPAKPYPNIQVINEGPIGPWLKAAEAILHNGCTTGFEAYLLGKKVYSYMPYISEEFDLKLPNEVSIKCFDKNELLKNIRCGFEAEYAQIDEKKQKFAEYYLANAGGKYAYQDIIDSIVGLSSGLPEFNVSDLISLRYDRNRNLTKKWICKFLLFLSEHRIPLPLRFEKFVYSFKKNPGFFKREILKNLEKIAGVTKINLANVHLSKIDEDAFVIHMDGMI